MTSGASPRRLIIAVATYRRPDDIGRCIRSVEAERTRFLAESEGTSVDILVVDNDAAGSGRQGVESYLSDHMRYVVETQPGISAARNRALDEARDHDLLAFIDDDEEVLPGWLGQLLALYDAHHPAAVVGRVISDFPEPLDPWIEAGGFFRRRTLPTGTRVHLGATNNLLLDLHLLRELGLRLEERYGLTGGSDSALTMRLDRAGGVLLWCDEAVVVDHVPASRATRAWVQARARRTGNSGVVVRLDLARSRRERFAIRAGAVVRGTVRLVAGSSARAAGTLTRSVSLDARGAKAVARGRGMLTGALGNRVGEYLRSEQPTGAAARRREERRVRVLASFPRPRVTTNPYITQLAQALDGEPGIDLVYFSWAGALFGRYDVFHVHWPEILLIGADRKRTWLRRAATVALLARCTLGRIPIVRTVHNAEPHEGVGALDAALLGWMDRRTRAWIDLHEPAEPGHALIMHGHYIDWFARYECPPTVPGRIVFAGQLRAYKNVEGLITAFRDTRSELTLRIVGSPRPASLAAKIEASAAADDRISTDLRFIEDRDLVREIGSAEVVALPYTRMHNSGAALLALSLGRPVLLPDTPANRKLAAEVGACWVSFFTAPLAAADLERAVDAARAMASARPDLSGRDWAEAGRAHLRVYRGALGRSQGTAS